MSKKQLWLFLFLLIITFSGCGIHSSEDTANISVTEQAGEIETVYETQLSIATEEPSLDLTTYDDTIAYLRTCEDKKAYQWMINLNAEDVEYVEFINLNDLKTPYRCYQGTEIQEVIDLFQKNGCYEYVDSASWQGYFTTEFHIVMKDGTAHSVCSLQSTETVIDGAAFRTMSYWLNDCWPETGNAPLPDDWEEMVDSRNYQVVEDEVSFLGTRSFEVDRAGLDLQYDTSKTMGAQSRNYPIGRGTVTLSAKDPTATGVTLDAYWTGTFRGGNLMVKPEFWLERWVEKPPIGDINYAPIEEGTLVAGYTPPNIAENAVQWRVQWGDTIGALEPGYYRIGMTFYEKINGVAQNETVCYAKFSVE